MTERYKNLLMNLKIYSLIIIAACLVLGVATDTANAQQQVLKLVEESVEDTEVTGAASRLFVRFWNDTNDPDASDYSPFWPTTAEIRLFNFNEDFDHAQNTSAGDFDEDDLVGVPAGYNPPVAIGWEYGLGAAFTPAETYDEFPESVRNDGQSDEKFKLLNTLPGALSGDFTSISSNNVGDGIDINENYAALISAGFNGLAGQPLVGSGGERIRYRMADMEIIFQSPVTNPVLHFSGLGGIWDVNFSFELTPEDDNNNLIIVDQDRNIILTDVDDGFEIYYSDDECTVEDVNGDYIQIYDGLDTDSALSCVNAVDATGDDGGEGEVLVLDYAEEFTNSATIDFQLIESASDNGVSISKLSGNTNFEVGSDDAILNNAGGSTTFSNLIFNNADNPDDTNGAAHGSVLVTGENITSLTFSIYARGTHEPDDKGFGWAGGEGWVATDQNSNIDDQINWNPNGDLEPLEYFFAEDAILLSISTNVEPDDEEISPEECYRMLSSPIVPDVNVFGDNGNFDNVVIQSNSGGGVTYGTLLDNIFTQGIVGSDLEQFDPHIFTWPSGVPEPDPNNEDYNNYDPVSDLDNQITPGEGFLISVFEDNDPLGDGEFGTKDLSVIGSEPPPFTYQLNNAQAGGWILFGNPFKSGIDLNAFFAESENLTGAAYIWDRTANDYLGGRDNVDADTPGSWRQWVPGDPGEGDIVDGIVAPFQAFFVQVLEGGTVTAEFNEDVKAVDGAGNYLNGTFYGKEAENNNNIVRLQLSGESLYNSMWLRFSQEGSHERTRGDALELHPLSADYAIFGTRKADNTLMAIAHYPEPDTDFEVPVHLEVTRAGNYTIEATHFNSFLSHDLYLVDLQEDVSIRMDENFRYDFTVNQAAKVNSGITPCGVLQDKSPRKANSQLVADRFVITTQPREADTSLPDEIALNQNYPNPFNPTTQITYELPQQTDVRLTVYDMVGRQVATLVNETVQAGVHNVTFDANNLSSGVYIYRLQTGSTTLSRKLTVIK